MPPDRGVTWSLLQKNLSECRDSFSPLPCTRGRGVGGEGVATASLADALLATRPAPSPPTPLPRVQGRGEKEHPARTSCWNRLLFGVALAPPGERRGAVDLKSEIAEKPRRRAVLRLGQAHEFGNRRPGADTHSLQFIAAMPGDLLLQGVHQDGDRLPGVAGDIVQADRCRLALGGPGMRQLFFDQGARGLAVGPNFSRLRRHSRRPRALGVLSVFS